MNVTAVAIDFIQGSKKKRTIRGPRSAAIRAHPTSSKGSGPEPQTSPGQREWGGKGRRQELCKCLEVRINGINATTSHSTDLLPVRYLGAAGPACSLAR